MVTTWTGFTLQNYPTLEWYRSLRGTLQNCHPRYSSEVVFNTLTLFHIHSGHSCSEQQLQAPNEEYWCCLPTPKRTRRQMQPSSFAHMSATRAYCQLCYCVVFRNLRHLHWSFLKHMSMLAFKVIFWGSLVSTCPSKFNQSGRMNQIHCKVALLKWQSSWAQPLLQTNNIKS